MSRVIFHRPQHQKRFDRAEKCCAALRQWMVTGASDAAGQNKAKAIALNSLLSWMRVAPASVKYQKVEE